MKSTSGITAATLACFCALCAASPESGGTGGTPQGQMAVSIPAPTNWPADELERIATKDDLHISPYREDGKTFGTPTWIWSVAVDGNLYVRAYNGVRSRWYQAAIRERAGRIIAAGMTRQVAFEPVQGAINAKIDAAYRVRYAGSPYLDSMIGERARAATVKILPAPPQKRG